MQTVLPGEDIYVKKKIRRFVNSKVIFFIEFTYQLFCNSLTIHFLFTTVISRP